MAGLLFGMNTSLKLQQDLCCDNDQAVLETQSILTLSWQQSEILDSQRHVTENGTRASIADSAAQ